MQGITHTGRHLAQLRGTTKDMSDSNIFGRNGGGKNQPAQPVGAWVAEELGDILDHASQRHNTVDKGYDTTQISSSNLTNLGREKRNLQGKAPYLLKPSPASHLSLRLLIKKSFASLLPTTGGGSTSPEDNPGPKKHPVRREIKEHVVHGDRVEDPLTIEPCDSGQSFFRPLDSPKRAQRTFTLQPSACAPSDNPEAIELRSLSTTHVSSHFHHHDDSVFPGQKSVNQFSGEAEPQGSISPHKSPRRSRLQSPSLDHQIFSSERENHRSVLTATPSPQARRNWSWRKLLLEDTESDARENFEGSNLSVGVKVEPEDTGLPRKISKMEYFPIRSTEEAKHSPTMSEFKHDENHEINPTKPGDITLKANESRTLNHIQPPLEPRTLPNASTEPDPALPRKPKRKQAHHHLSDCVAHFPLESLSQGSSSAGYLMQSKATSSNGPSKKRKGGQTFKRLQIIVSLDGLSDVIVEARMNAMRMSGEGEGLERSWRGVGDD